MSDAFDADGNRLLTAVEAAELAGIDRESYLARVQRGSAPQPVMSIGKTYLFREDEVQQWARWRTRRS